MNNGFAFAEENMGTKAQLLKLATNPEDRFHETGVGEIITAAPTNTERATDGQIGDAPYSVADPFTSNLAGNHTRFNGVASLIHLSCEESQEAKVKNAFPSRKESREILQGLVGCSCPK